MRKIKYFSFVLLLLVMTVFISACSPTTKKDYSATVDDGDVMKLSLFTYDGKGESHFGLMNLGHTFLSFENISSEDIVVGKMTVKAGETIAVGTWSVKSHFGIWYNLEGNYIDFNDKYNGRVSVTIGLSSKDMLKVNAFIETHDYWNPLRNCSYFALNLYNEVAEIMESIPTPLIYTPTYIAGHIREFKSFDTNKAIDCADKFGYFDGDKYIEYSFSEVENEDI